MIFLGCVQFYGWWFFQWKSIDKSPFHVWWCGPLSFFVHYMKSSFEELLRDLQIISKELFLSSWNLVSTTNLNTAKEITNKIPQSQSPPAENLDKKHIFSVYCRNKTAMYHDRAQIFRCGMTQQPYKHLADTVRIRPPLSCSVSFQERVARKTVTDNSLRRRGMETARIKSLCWLNNYLFL